MPAPVFIICSESGSIDRHTNRLSIYDVIEKVTLQPVDLGAGAAGGEIREGMQPVAFNSIRMVAVWRMMEGEEGQEFEFKTTLQLPGQAEPLQAGHGSFLSKTALHRLLATMHTNLPVRSGEMVVTNAIRQSGQEAWISQEYRIPVEVRGENPQQGNLPLGE